MKKEVPITTESVSSMSGQQSGFLRIFKNKPGFLTVLFHLVMLIANKFSETDSEQRHSCQNLIGI